MARPSERRSEKLIVQPDRTAWTRQPATAPVGAQVFGEWRLVDFAGCDAWLMPGHNRSLKNLATIFSTVPLGRRSLPVYVVPAGQILVAGWGCKPP
jgi:hypothetical protein